MNLPLGHGFFDRPFLTAARELIGVTLHWHGCGGRIVEVEGYAIEGDPACHTATRRSSRKFCEENPPGTAYVYLNYGLHWMLNVLARDGIILIRALEPTHGIPLMQRRRGMEKLSALCSGPGKLGQALGLTGADHGTDLTGGHFRQGTAPSLLTETPAPPAGRGAPSRRKARPGGAAAGSPLPLTTTAGPGFPSDGILAVPRIGITRAVDFPWRFLEAGSPWVSVKPPRQPAFAPAPSQR